MSINMARECLFAILSSITLSSSLLVASVVDRLVLKPCCEGDNRLFISKWCVILLFIIVSKIFARVGRSEIGL